MLGQRRRRWPNINPCPAELFAFIFHLFLLTQFQMPKILIFRKNIHVQYCIIVLTEHQAFHLGPSAARLPVDELALASIMTHDYAKDLCASEDIGAIEVLLIDWLVDWSTKNILLNLEIFLLIYSILETVYIRLQQDTCLECGDRL